jgi:hypothetical protein
MFSPALRYFQKRLGKKSMVSMKDWPDTKTMISFFAYSQPALKIAIYPQRVSLNGACTTRRVRTVLEWQNRV